MSNQCIFKNIYFHSQIDQTHDNVLFKCDTMYAPENDASNSDTKLYTSVFALKFPKDTKW